MADLINKDFADNKIPLERIDTSKEWQSKFKIRTDLAPKEFKKQFLDPISASFCMAKWMEATIWLYLGETASCHHNPTHKIELDPNDPKTLHNTPTKIHERHRMLKGEKPNGCSYCWNAEKFDQVSDRYLKSRSYNSHLITSDIPDVILPQRLEIAFSRTCNLACAYCGPKFSNTWAKDLQKHGPYDIQTNNKYQDTFKDKVIKEEDNPYIQAFFDWWPELKKDLITMRFTGGEPLLHTKFWEFLDLIENDTTYKGSLIVNSNLIHKNNILEKFIEKTKWIWNNPWTPPGRNRNGVEIHTSCESNMAQAEWIRDGFEADKWYKNVRTVLKTSNIRLTMTTAVSNATVWSYVEYLRMCQTLRKEFGKERVNLNANRVYHPHFYQIQLIPKELRRDLADEIEYCMKNEFDLLDDETSQLQIWNLVDFLRNSDYEPIDGIRTETIHMDMVKFFDQYKIRRNKTNEGLDERYVNWLEETRQRYWPGQIATQTHIDNLITKVKL